MASIGVIRNLCAAFLFQGDDVDKRIAKLSGGEKSRVVLAMLLARPLNFLVLDEPTNHLDIQSREVLLEALQEFRRHRDPGQPRPPFPAFTGHRGFLQLIMARCSPTKGITITTCRKAGLRITEARAREGYRRVDRKEKAAGDSLARTIRSLPGRLQYCFQD